MDQLCKDNVMCCDDNCKRCANLIYKEYLKLKSEKEVVQNPWVYKRTFLKDSNMDIKIYNKPVITRFVMINEEEFKLGMLIACLEQISETNEDDHWGDYSLREYELYCTDTMNKLVKMGLVKNYTGSRMADLYCMKDKKGIEKLLDTLYELDINFKE